ncbi:THO complex subunit 7 -like protein [Halotydeus destructor]|nr:THO complex subunit 7 -like protein [Halotydeus destructor]
MSNFRLSDEEIIKRKLMFDGEGVGDDRRLNFLIKAFCVWSNQLRQEEIPQHEKDVNYERMMIMLGDAELSMQKSECVKSMCSKEQNDYEKIFGSVEGDIDASKSQLVNLKEQLQVAKAERKNKSEANALVKRIEEFPSRLETNHKLSQANDEIANLEKQTVELKSRIEQWKDQFDVLYKAAAGLNILLEQGIENENTDPSSQEEPMEVVTIT